ncbi:hypothetical protein NUU61_000074 [Penicillium alfredii]|uniref:Altered inheritance of mitochondria protein 3 n=1 Tax=Penicillium alfredii TaxID=1506179 RepID=A0A9W9KQA5_9EURO|nr:uncharacterized protein NUU61_000074 [Penicillium alfredii]KAJ5114315.1 hypothetical protein NUU61_000074 [Penicillium alfredii]
MSGLGKMVREGWHPKGKEGGKESWRGDFKGINQVAGWMGKGKDPSADRSEHVSQPLSSLKDPSSFGPPPKHVNYHGPGAVANQTPDRCGIGAPLSQDQVDSQNAHRQREAEAEEEQARKPAPPPVPYRVNTTGLSTDNLPPPPVRRLDSPSSASPATNTKPKPQLPPRIPPRNGPSQSPSPPAYSSVPPSLSNGYVNQDATSRLSNAGVSVPALGIGEEGGRPSPPASANNTPVNEIQSRFSRMTTDSGSPSAPSPPARAGSNQGTDPAGGTSSVQNFRERHADKIDMGKQKLGGVTSRISTLAGSGSSAPSPPARPNQDAEPGSSGSSVQNFRDRHADTIDAGKQKLGGVTSRINTFVEDRKFSANANQRIPRPPPRPSAASPQEPEEQAPRKKPPPPPPKRREMRASPVDTPSPSSPPPVPLNTKPR